MDGVVAALIALEKTLPWRRARGGRHAAILLVLAARVVAAPDAMPGSSCPAAA